MMCSLFQGKYFLVLKSNGFRAYAITLGIFLLCVGVASGQIFPAFNTPTAADSSTYQPEFATSSATVPNGVYGTVVFTAFASNVGNRVAYGISADGQNYVFGTSEANLPIVQCSPAFADLCGVGVANFGGNIYLAYANTSQELVIVEGTVVPGNVGYQFTLLQTYPPGIPLTTVPAMVVFNNQLQIIFGASSNPNTKNAFYQVTCATVGSQCTAPNEANLGALGTSSASTPGLAAITVNGQLTLFMCSQENNSHHNLELYSSTDGTTWVNTVPGGISAFQLGGGAQMVAYNNTLVLANQQNNSNRELVIFSSPDGLNWSVQGYPSIQMAGAPGLTLFGNGLSLSLTGDGSNTLFGSFAAN